MREILFRGKRTDNGERIEGCLITSEFCSSEYSIGYLSSELHHIDEEDVIPETVGQYTGLTDKNGKKIFEGDIVKTHYANANNAEFIETVVFEGGGFRAKTTYDNGSHSAPLYDGTPHLATDKSVYMDNIAVIGNIHDNPELLEGEVDNG